MLLKWLVLLKKLLNQIWVFYLFYGILSYFILNLCTVALKLIEEGKAKEAVEMKRKEVAKLREVAAEDSSGFITKLINNEERAIGDMETKSMSEAKKSVHYNNYVHECNDYFTF